jgi:hypothetical protein
MSSSPATQGIFITGHPLTEAVYIPNPSPDEGDEGQWLLNIPQAEIVLDAWASAPAAEDVIRNWERFEIGLLVTALAMEGEINISGWESVTGSDGTDIYSTGSMPFDFEISPVHN